MERERKRMVFCWFKAVGLVAASVLIIFGGVGNFVRTVKFGMKKLRKR